MRRGLMFLFVSALVWSAFALPAMGEDEVFIPLVYRVGEQEVNQAPDETSTATHTAAPTPTATETPTFTIVPTKTATETATATEESTATPIETSTLTATQTATVEETATPTETPTATATATATATPTPTSTATPTETATATPTQTSTATATPCQTAPADSNLNGTLTIPLDNTVSMLDFVSYPDGDSQDRVNFEVSGMNPNPSLSGGQARLVISASCFGTGTANIEFFTGGQSYACGQTLVDKIVTADSDTGSITIEAVAGACTYVQWVITGTATRTN